MTKPATFPTFATDTNYTGGPEAGTPTKSAWTSGRKQEGLEPGTKQLAAQNLNEHFNNIGEWIKFLGYRVGRITEIYTDWQWLSVNAIQKLIDASAGVPTNSGITFNGVWNFGTVTSSDSLNIPLFLDAGSYISSFAAWINKTSASGTITAKLVRVSLTTGSTTVMATANNSANNPGRIVLSAGLSTPYKVTSAERFAILINPGGITGDSLEAASISGIPQPRLQGETHWNSALTGTGVISLISNATTGGMGARVNLPANADAVSVGMAVEVLTAPCPANMLHILEWELDTTELVGTPGLTFVAGFGSLNGTNDTVGIEKTSASANYFLRTTSTTGPATGTTDTGIAAASGITRFTLMWYGASVDSSGARAELYINNVLVATRTTTLPTTDAMGFLMSFTSTGATTSLFDISPVCYRGVRYLLTD
jgi:hypothetical protein